jgi:hypothetical protein
MLWALIVPVWNGELSSIPWIGDDIVFSYIPSCCGG